jgi:anti-sigma factor RsiW
MPPSEPSPKCKEVFSLLSQFLDLELPPEACQEIESHLAGCPPCIEFAESLRSTVELCREYEPAELPAPLASDARKRIEVAYRAMLTERGIAAERGIMDKPLNDTSYEQSGRRSAIAGAGGDDRGGPDSRPRSDSAGTDSALLDRPAARR